MLSRALFVAVKHSGVEHRGEEASQRPLEWEQKYTWHQTNLFLLLKFLVYQLLKRQARMNRGGVWFPLRGIF